MPHSALFNVGSERAVWTPAPGSGTEPVCSDCCCSHTTGGHRHAHYSKILSQPCDIAQDPPRGTSRVRTSWQVLFDGRTVTFVFNGRLEEAKALRDRVHSIMAEAVCTHRVPSRIKSRLSERMASAAATPSEGTPAPTPAAAATEPVPPAVCCAGIAHTPGATHCSGTARGAPSQGACVTA